MEGKENKSGLDTIWNVCQRSKFTIAIVTILILNGIGGGIHAIKLFLPDKTTKAFEKIIDESVERSVKKYLPTIVKKSVEEEMKKNLALLENKIEDAGNKSSVRLVAWEFGRYKTMQEVDARLDYINRQQWGAQIVAMKIVAESKRAEKQVVPRLLDEKFAKRILNKYK